MSIALWSPVRLRLQIHVEDVVQNKRSKFKAKDQIGDDGEGGLKCGVEVTGYRTKPGETTLSGSGLFSGRTFRVIADYLAANYGVILL